jgi:hypothetical protein
MESLQILINSFSFQLMEADLVDKFIIILLSLSAWENCAINTIFSQETCCWEALQKNGY